MRRVPRGGGTFNVLFLPFLADCVIPPPIAYGFKYKSFLKLSYGIKVKRASQTVGLAWLFLRMEIGLCIGGRLDYAIVIMNEQCEVVAVSHPTAVAGTAL